MILMIIWHILPKRQDFREYTGALKAPVRCFGNQLSGKGKSSFRTDNECGGAASLIIPGLFEPPVRTLRATIPENEGHIFQ